MPISKKPEVLSLRASAIPALATHASTTPIVSHMEICNEVVDDVHECVRHTFQGSRRLFGRPVADRYARNSIME